MTKPYGEPCRCIFQLPPLWWYEPLDDSVKAIFTMRATKL